MNYENLKDAIIAVIKQNGNEEITGNILQQVLVAMVNSLGNGYQFKGIATPATDPGTIDQRVFYIAYQPGSVSYPNFGVTVADALAVLYYDTEWHVANIFELDDELSEAGQNLATSGVIYAALQNLADVYMQLVESAEENHLAIFDGDGQVKDAGIGLDELALPAGHYPGLFAGFAGNLVDTRSAGTRQGPYAFRQSGGDGVDYMVRIKGRTEVFNQLVGDNDTEVTVPSGHQYFAIIGGTASVATSDGSPISVTGGVDIVVDLTLEGLGLTTAAAFQSLHPLPYYNPMSKLINNAATGIKTVGFNVWDEVREGGPLDNTGAPASGNADTFRGANFIRVIEGQTYYFNAPSDYVNGAIYYVWGYDANKAAVSNFASNNAVSQKTFTIPAGVCYIKWYIYKGGSGWKNNMPAFPICINISDASRNGTYEPYWERTLALGLNSIPCHDENNNAVVVNGLDGVGTSQDELIVENGWGTKINKNRARVDLGSIAWSIQDQGGTHERATSSALRGIIMPNTANNVVPNVITSEYIAITPNASYVHATEGISVDTAGDIYIYAAAFIGMTGAQVQAALSGVYLDYPLATPKVLTVDTPFAAFVEVDNLGTQERLPADTADNPQGGFESDSNYSVSTANLVRKLSEL